MKPWLRTKVGLKVGIALASWSSRRLHQSTGSCVPITAQACTRAVNEPRGTQRVVTLPGGCDAFLHTWPFSMTMILLQLITVLRRWAMMRVVQLPNTLWMVSWMRRSVSVSIAAVASSRIRIWKHDRSAGTINATFLSLFWNGASPHTCCRNPFTVTMCHSSPQRMQFQRLPLGGSVNPTTGYTLISLWLKGSLIINKAGECVWPMSLSPAWRNISRRRDQPTHFHN